MNSHIYQKNIYMRINTYLYYGMSLLGMVGGLFIQSRNIYDFISTSSDNTSLSIILLLLKQFMFWSLYLEITPQFWGMLLSKTIFWNRYHHKTTKEGTLIHDEIRDGIMISVQHIVSTLTTAYGFYYNNLAFARFGITAEIAYEINDIITIIFNLRRNKTKPILIKVVLLSHHFFGTLTFPVFLYYLDVYYVQNVIMALIGSGTILCIMLPIQYVPDIKTIRGSRVSFVMHTIHLIEFVYMRWYIGFANNEWFKAIELVYPNYIVYPFVIGISSIILFNIIITIIFFERFYKSAVQYFKNNE